MENPYTQALLTQARLQAEELSRHIVLSQYWERLSLVLKGSTARGDTDEYSDLDLVIFCPEEIRQAIVHGYHVNGLCNREDGIFMFFPNGHYHAESYDQLKGYFLHWDFIHCWDYGTALPLHDPNDAFRSTITEGGSLLFSDPLAIVKRAYLDLQLDLDWMRMPILRADGPSTHLHTAKLLQGICRMAYLLESRPYPPDKWLFYYLSGTKYGSEKGEAIRAFYEIAPLTQKLERGCPFEEHPLYEQAARLIGEIATHIRRRYGEQPWLGPWYNYV
jgi:hypothetical protein